MPAPSDGEMRTAPGHRPFRVLAVTSNRDGVGKATIASNLAVHIRSLEEDLPVLVLSLDDQSLLDRMFAPEGPVAGTGPTIETAWRQGDLRSGIRGGRYGVHYVPTSAAMPSLEAQLRSRFELTRILQRTGWRGLVIVDTKSDLEILSQNAIAASDLAILVVSDHAALEGLEQVFELLDELGRPRDAARILLSRVDLRVTYRAGEKRDVLGGLLSEIRRRDLPLFGTFVSRSPKVESLCSHGERRASPVLHHARGSLSDRQLTHLARDVLAAIDVAATIGRPPPTESSTSTDAASRPAPQRRQAMRRVYRRPVAAFREREPSVLSLVARDLSPEGMCCDASDAVESGERLHLALEPREDAEPLLVWGRVTRTAGAPSDGAQMAVVFESVDADLRQRLLELLRGLPKDPGSEGPPPATI